jgi:hypothetical protein
MVCTGTGAAALAAAISVVDLGGEVFVAGAPGGDALVEAGAPHRVHNDRTQPWLVADVSDSETTAYFAALSSDLGPFRRSAWDVDVPICVVHEPPVESGRSVAPFVGSRLREWTARCLASPYGYLKTRVSDLQSTTLHTIDGDMIEVAEIGSISPDPTDVGGSVYDWLTAEADDRRIDIEPDCSLQRIVFEEGDAVGAVFTTPDGELAIRARHGVTVATGGPRINTALPHQLSAGDAALRVCLVTRFASRFGRVELLTSGPLASHAPTTCGPANRDLHVNLRETHDRSPMWRCGRMSGYPPVGQ